MAVTRAQLESALIARAGALWAAIGNPVTVAGDNASLDDLLATAAYEAGLTPADPATLTNTDLADAGMAARANLLARATLAMLETIRDNWVHVDSTINMKSLNKGQILKQLDIRIENLRADIRSKYTPVTPSAGLSPLAAGTIDLNFAATDDGPEF